ncbi:hypothetical protein BDF21DRAFT_472753 [Thamnidium elegans]|nr:hypothetical protein BDF21DRAFT_472753 [Thamnidium elegans]
MNTGFPKVATEFFQKFLIFPKPFWETQYKYNKLVTMDSKATQGGCLDYMYSCFESLKNSFKDYRAYASGYDSHQYAKDAEFKLRRLVSEPVPPKEGMKTLANNIIDNVTHTFACGVFAFTSLIRSEKKDIENYFCPKKTSTFNAYYIDEDGTDSDEEEVLFKDTCINEDEYYCIDEYDTDEYDMYIDEFNMNMDEYDMDVDDYETNIEEYDTCDTDILSPATCIDEDDTQYPLARTFDNSWGFIDHDDLSVELKDTTLSPKRPQKIVDISHQILFQAKAKSFSPKETSH